MGQWIKEAEAKGRSNAQTNQSFENARGEAREAFFLEDVDEEAVEQFLGLLKFPMFQVKAELEAQGYTVEDQGYQYNPISYADQSRYALVNCGIDHEVEAYGQTWFITTPTGEELDTLRLFSSVDERTHFAKGEYSFLAGGSGCVNPADNYNTALATLQNLIAERITDYFERGI